jgi:hypothetical protein
LMLDAEKLKFFVEDLSLMDQDLGLEAQRL